jgi:pimeloyl-ACP methyl ester carboxylesterase
VTRETLRLPDGRDLEFVQRGASARAVVLHQGTLTDMTGWEGWMDEFAARGVSAVAFNRSGYGHSSPLPGRRTLDVGRDVAHLATHLGVEAFVSVGWSGGGSHALATALDPRCRGVLTLAGIAPFGVDDLDFYEGLKDDDVAEYHAALRDVEELIALVGSPDHGNQWCEPDARALASPDFAPWSAAMDLCATFGLSCLVDDYSAYLSPWGFEVASLDVPVVLFQGDLDQNVPIGHARWLHRHLARSELRVYPGEGHLSLVLSRRGEIIESALALLEDAESLQQ